MKKTLCSAPNRLMKNYFVLLCSPPRSRLVMVSLHIRNNSKCRRNISDFFFFYFSFVRFDHQHVTCATRKLPAVVRTNRRNEQSPPRTRKKYTVNTVIFRFCCYLLSPYSHFAVLIRFTLCIFTPKWRQPERRKKKIVRNVLDAECEMERKKNSNAKRCESKRMLCTFTNASIDCSPMGSSSAVRCEVSIYGVER